MIPEQELFNSLPRCEQKFLYDGGQWENAENCSNFLKRFKFIGNSGELLGYLDLLRDLYIPETGFHIIVVSPKARRMGIATTLIENMTCFTKIFRQRLKLKRINWLTIKDNKASCVLAEKLGWTKDVNAIPGYVDGVNYFYIVIR